MAGILDQLLQAYQQLQQQPTPEAQEAAFLDKSALARQQAGPDRDLSAAAMKAQLASPPAPSGRSGGGGGFDQVDVNKTAYGMFGNRVDPATAKAGLVSQLQSFLDNPNMVQDDSIRRQMQIIAPEMFGGEAQRDTAANPLQAAQMRQALQSSSGGGGGRSGFGGGSPIPGMQQRGFRIGDPDPMPGGRGFAGGNPDYASLQSSSPGNAEMRRKLMDSLREKKIFNETLRNETVQNDRRELLLKTMQENMRELLKKKNIHFNF